jgi:hypothetical protein
MRGYRLYVRSFLNRPGFNRGAYILVTIPDDLDRYSTPEFTIADCSRVVSLDFDVSSRSARKNSLRKADMLVDAVTRFRESLADHIEEFDARRGGDGAG